MKFKVGDKVRCVHPGNSHSMRDMEYVVEAVRPSTSSRDEGLISVAGRGGAYFGRRFELVEEAPKTTPHKWATVLRAMADGQSIEKRLRTDYGWSDWRETKGILNSPTFEYRVKPEKKPDVVQYLGVEPAMKNHHQSLWKQDDSNIQCTFDGETGKLKAVSLINAD